MRICKLLTAFLHVICRMFCTSKYESNTRVCPIQPIPESKPTIVTGAIFTNGRDLFGDLRSYQSSDIKVGDLVTVFLMKQRRRHAHLRLLRVEQLQMTQLGMIKKTLSLTK